jgi:hypothetical protein
VKPEVAFDDPPLLSPIPEIPLLPAPRVDTWRRASEAYPLVFAEREMSDGTTLTLLANSKAVNFQLFIVSYLVVIQFLGH